MKRMISILLVLAVLFCMVPMASAAWTPLRTAGKVRIQVGEVTHWQVSWSDTTFFRLENADDFVTWSSANPAVATVDRYGYIVGHRPGRADITVTRNFDGAKKTVGITVLDSSGYNGNTEAYGGQPTGIQTAGKTTINVGETVRWTASVLPSNASNKFLYWNSGYPAVATVDQNGNITGHREGKAHITITAANGVKKTLTLTVQAKPTEVKVPLSGLPSIGNKFKDYTLTEWASVCTDNYGRQYSRAYNMSGYVNTEKNFRYLTSGQYQFFEATFFVLQGSNADESGNLKIVGDGVTLYNSPTLYKNSAPVYVRVNVAGYNDIQIIMTRSVGSDYGFQTGLANASFVKW